MPAYNTCKYDTLERFASYWHQINAVAHLSPNSLLEIGVGNRFVSNYLKHTQIKTLVTMDINYYLKPDCVSSVLNIPFKRNAFDVVLCSQVLEHLPFESFAAALKELSRVCSSAMVLSLPDSLYYVGMHVRTFLGGQNFLISFPRLSGRKHYFDGEHYWEIGKKNYPLSKIIGTINKCGFKVKHQYRLNENHYHRFFILQKTLS